ncbi:MAG: DUF4190 domain-containing protein [Nanoarchaeota archaeon]|nr:DUF4190 domain-containing protein [Nanoarchaeota archaeon]
MAKGDFNHASYLLGILSIIFSAVFQPLAGIVLGITGLVLSQRDKDDISKKGRKFSTIGIILGIIVLVLIAVGLSKQLGADGSLT